MKKPSADFRIDETNDLLAQVPGLGFRVEGRQNVTGGRSKPMDSRMKVEDTNKMVESITGGGLKALNESGPSSMSHRPLHEDYANDQDSIASCLNDLKADMEDALGDLQSEIHSGKGGPDGGVSTDDMKHDFALLKNIHAKVVALCGEAKRLKVI